MAKNNQALADKIKNNQGNQSKNPATVALANLRKRAIPTLEKYLKSSDKAERLFQCYFDACRKNSKLLECSPDSVLLSLTMAAQLNLFPDASGEAALIPYRGECQLQSMYQGILKHVYNSGLIKEVNAAVVYPGEYFEQMRGTENYIRHIPEALEESDNYVGAWCVIKLTTGGNITKYMSKAQINKIRDGSSNHQSARKYNKKSVWDNFSDSQRLKTVFKQAAKWAPKSVELAKVIDYDNSQERPEFAKSNHLPDIDATALPKEDAQALPEAESQAVDLAAMGVKTAEAMESSELTEQEKQEISQSEGA